MHMLNSTSLHDTPLRFDDVGHKPASHRIMNALLSDLANQFVSGGSEPVKFGLVEDEDTWNSIRGVRKKVYSSGSPHLKQLVNNEGYDEYDKNSFVFYAKYQHEILGTIRLNRYPFEVKKFLNEEVLSDYLGLGWKDQFLEISRLAVDSKPGITGISNALVVYASLITACSTQYKYYLAYSHPKLKDRVFKFQQHREMLSFLIPSRRSIEYVLFKGVFWDDFSALIAEHGGPLFESLRREFVVAGEVNT